MCDGLLGFFLLDDCPPSDFHTPNCSTDSSPTTASTIAGGHTGTTAGNTGTTTGYTGTTAGDVGNVPGNMGSTAVPCTNGTSSCLDTPKEKGFDSKIEQ